MKQEDCLSTPASGTFYFSVLLVNRNIPESSYSVASFWYMQTFLSLNIACALSPLSTPPQLRSAFQTHSTSPLSHFACCGLSQPIWQLVGIYLDYERLDVTVDCKNAPCPVGPLYRWMKQVGLSKADRGRGAFFSSL